MRTSFTPDGNFTEKKNNSCHWILMAKRLIFMRMRRSEFLP